MDETRAVLRRLERIEALDRCRAARMEPATTRAGRVALEVQADPQASTSITSATPVV
jgi:hypothetical protein